MDPSGLVIHLTLLLMVSCLYKKMQQNGATTKKFCDDTHDTIHLISFFKSLQFLASFVQVSAALSSLSLLVLPVSVKGG